MRVPRRRIIIILVFAFIVLGGTLLSMPPGDFVPRDVVIEHGDPLSQVTETLRDARIVAHPVILKLVLQLSGAGTRIQAGTYRFESSQNVFTIARRLTEGVTNLPLTRITLPEGLTNREMALRLTEVLPNFSTAEFMVQATSYEGYLFPDTYLFLPSISEEKIIATLREQFDITIEPLLVDIQQSGHSLAEIVTMASLLEKEVRTTENRKIVAGILWDRLQIGMPLQVDAVFGYIFNRETYSPSLADLKIDSPYNTYLYKGLPPTPINNPGLDALKAALYPTKTPYLYYLTDRDGNIHYAATYANHLANQKKYLR